MANKAQASQQTHCRRIASALSVWCDRCTSLVRLFVRVQSFVTRMFKLIVGFRGRALDGVLSFFHGLVNPFAHTLSRTLVWLATDHPNDQCQCRQAYLKPDATES
jgi:hypothetical protein